MEIEVLPIVQPARFKKNDIKALITGKIKRAHPSFKFLTYTGVFHFQRKRTFRNKTLREAIHIAFSMEDYTMKTSISSRLNPVHTLIPLYNNGIINPHVDLLAIKDGTDVFPMNHITYNFNNRPETFIDMIDLLIDDVNTIAIPWFDHRWNDIQTNVLLNNGLDIIAGWDFEKIALRNELRLQIRKAKMNVKNLRQSVANELKEKLLAIPCQPSEVREQIPQLVFDLLELYCGSQIT